VKVSTTWGSTDIKVQMRSGLSPIDNDPCGRIAVDRSEDRNVDENDFEKPPGVPGNAVVRTREPWQLMAGCCRYPEGQSPPSAISGSAQAAC
jgi:crotonobetaine/carnitine-CoA ligase